MPDTWLVLDKKITWDSGASCLGSVLSLSLTSWAMLGNVLNFSGFYQEDGDNDNPHPTGERVKSICKVFLVVLCTGQVPIKCYLLLLQIRNQDVQKAAGVLGII